MLNLRKRIANKPAHAHKLIIAEIKKKIEHELYMAEAAATAGWGAVAVLENKMFTNVSGTDAEKEMKSQKIRKHRGNGRRKFVAEPYAYGGYGGYGAMGGQEGQEGYRQNYGPVVNFRGRGSGGYRGDGGSRRGTRPTRTCHRCKSAGHLVANCPVPGPQADK